MLCFVGYISKNLISFSLKVLDLPAMYFFALQAFWHSLQKRQAFSWKFTDFTLLSGLFQVFYSSHDEEKPFSVFQSYQVPFTHTSYFSLHHKMRKLAKLAKLRPIFYLKIILISRLDLCWVALIRIISNNHCLI